MEHAIGRFALSTGGFDSTLGFQNGIARRRGLLVCFEDG